jgi:salicylate hydroxylase
LGSRLLGDHVYHADGTVAMLRNLLMRQMNVERFCEKLSWLYEAPFERPMRPYAA